MADKIPFSLQKHQTPEGSIHAIKFRYLIDFRTFTWRTSKMQMRTIINEFLRSEKSFEYDLSMADCRVLETLASFIGDGIECDPGYKKLLQTTRIGSNSTLSQSIIKLENLKIILVERKFKDQNKYKFNLDFILLVREIRRIRLHKFTIVNKLSTISATDLSRNKDQKQKLFIRRQKCSQEQSYPQAQSLNNKNFETTTFKGPAPNGDTALRHQELGIKK